MAKAVLRNIEDVAQDIHEDGVSEEDALRIAEQLLDLTQSAMDNDPFSMGPPPSSIQWRYGNGTGWARVTYDADATT